MKPFVHTSLLALMLTLGILPATMFSQDDLSNWYIQEVFLLADLNQDKYLSESEILQLRENFAYYQNPKHFEITDQNKDGYLDYPEFRYRFGQALVHRQEVDGKELKVLSENYPYFEDAAYKYLKRHPQLAASLMNNLIWTREHPDMMKQIVSDRSWLAKEHAIAESLSSNLIWLAENPGLAKKFYQHKKTNSISDIWQSWGISHMEYMAEHPIEQGVQIDFPYWPSETPSSTKLIADTPSPGERQKWIDSLLMSNESLQLALDQASSELARRDSIAKTIFQNEESAISANDLKSLQAENESLRTRVRQMMIEKKLARIEEDQLLATTIKQRKQIAFLEKQQEFTETDGVLSLNSRSPVEEELARLESDVANRDQRIKDLNKALADINQKNIDLLKENKNLEKLSDSFAKDRANTKQEIKDLRKQLASKDAEQTFLAKEAVLQNKIQRLEEENESLVAMREKLEDDKRELEASLVESIKSEQAESKDLYAIEDQYKQQILALEIELEKAMARLDEGQIVADEKQASLAIELKQTKALIASLEKQVAELENEQEVLRQNLAAETDVQAERLAWQKEKETLSNTLAQSNKQIVALMAEQESLQANLEQFREKEKQGKQAEGKLWAAEKDSLALVLAQNKKQILALQADKKMLTASLEDLKGQTHREQNWTDARLKERDSLYQSLSTATSQILQLEKQVAENKQKSLEATKPLADNSEAVSPNEYDALFLQVKELEYSNARLKSELDATLGLAQEREAILEKRLKSSLKESNRMATRMARYKRRKKYMDSQEEDRLDKMAVELEEGRARLKDLDEVNRALLAQLQANNNYLGQNISKRDQYKQELTHLKSSLTKLERQNDSLRVIARQNPASHNSKKDSLMAYQEKIYKLEQRIQLNQKHTTQQIASLKLEIDSLETEAIALAESRTSLAQANKVEASRSQLAGDRERKLLQRESQLQEKDLTLRQKEKVLEEKLKELDLKEKKYQDMRLWEEQLHLLERKLKNHPAYQKVNE